jgi:hypothetical protein
MKFAAQCSTGQRTLLYMHSDNEAPPAGVELSAGAVLLKLHQDIHVSSCWPAAVAGTWAFFATIATSCCF